MCGAPLAWRDLDLVDAQRLDAGWGFVAKDGTRPFAGQGITVPTFETVLREFPNVHLNIDLKGDDSVQAVLAMLRTHDAEDRVTLASFNTPTLISIRRAGFTGETGLAQAEVATLFTVPALVWRQLPFTGDAAQVPLNVGPLRFDRAAFIAKCHAVGLRVDFWTIDDATEATRLLELGADGIMTNDPAAMKILFD
jgi:glycerophosphoryl diester phosphodiesterase